MNSIIVNKLGSSRHLVWLFLSICFNTLMNNSWICNVPKGFPNTVLTMLSIDRHLSV